MTQAHHFDPSILREYDVRGIFGETLFPADARAIGRSFAAFVLETLSAGAHGLKLDQPGSGNAGRDICQAGKSGVQGSAPGDLKMDGPGAAEAGSDGFVMAAGVDHSADPATVVVGRDGRLSSPELEQALVAGLVEGGVDVIRIGLAATPMLYFAEASTPQVHGGIQVTGSHNPADHNGFKLVLGGAPYFGEQIARLGARCAVGAGTVPDRPGRIREHDVLPVYVAALLAGLEGIQPNDVAALRIGWDAGNGAAGPALERLTSLLPGEHHLLFSEVDGRFPNHHPDPTVEANLADLRALVAAKNLDFGVAFDGDADRLGVIDALGRVLDADALLAIFAHDVLLRHPGARVIADVKASRAVFDAVTALGGVAEMAPSGHSHIKSRMKQTGALLGGETSGHFFFADDWFGFDDGLYAAVRLIAAVVGSATPLADLRDAMPHTCTTPELRFTVAETRKFAVINEVRARLAASGAQVNDLDGVRVDTADGWWLLRASNTQAALTARAESDTPEGLERLVGRIDAQLAASGVSRTPA
ncbi:phosphoglucomutase/phosphomannomutase PgmG [Novosphingobium gossypii]|uniref:phosphoglucomutase/phosphomannomutase PgmG n=1 Tax=Novosphingobium gossypii TaxID=1604774 RepID=UPI003D1983BD